MYKTVFGMASLGEDSPNGREWVHRLRDATSRDWWHAELWPGSRLRPSASDLKAELRRMQPNSNLRWPPILARDPQIPPWLAIGWAVQAPVRSIRRVKARLPIFLSLLSDKLQRPSLLREQTKRTSSQRSTTGHESAQLRDCLTPAIIGAPTCYTA